MRGRASEPAKRGIERALPGPPDAEEDARPLVYQLILVQTVYDRVEDFDGLAAVLNNHPLLRGEPHTTDKTARELYERLLARYGVEAAEASEAKPCSAGRKKGVPRHVEVLAECLYAQYMTYVRNAVHEEKQEFLRLYSAIDKELEE